MGSRVIYDMKKNQDPKEALKSLIAEARAQAANIESACVLLENASNGTDPEEPNNFLDKMADLYYSRAIINKLRKVLQENFVRVVNSSSKHFG